MGGSMRLFYSPKFAFPAKGGRYSFWPMICASWGYLNWLGWPALTLPNGKSEEGLPTGVQLVGPPDGEERLLVLGHRLEEALGWAAKFPIQARFPAKG